MNLLRKLRVLFRREALDAEMAEEMRAHLELQAAENEKRGMSADEARHAAQRFSAATRGLRRGAAELERQTAA